MKLNLKMFWGYNSTIFFIFLSGVDSLYAFQPELGVSSFPTIQRKRKFNFFTLLVTLLKNRNICLT